MTKSREELVDEMLDREAIRDLPVRYCHYVWTHNLEGILSLFTDDGLFSTEGPTEPYAIKGQAELRKFYSTIPDRVGARPFIHNVVVDLKERPRGHRQLLPRAALRRPADEMDRDRLLRRRVRESRRPMEVQGPPLQDGPQRGLALKRKKLQQHKRFGAEALLCPLSLS